MIFKPGDIIRAKITGGSLSYLYGGQIAIITTINKGALRRGDLQVTFKWLSTGDTCGAYLEFMAETFELLNPADLTELERLYYGV